jgi:CRISPR-associated protein Cmr4
MSVQRVFLLHALAPLHVGVDEGLGAIDLPTMREVHTGYPIVPGSSVKGVLRDEAEVRMATRPRDVEAAFGPPQNRSSDFRGGAVFTDAQLLCLPVRTLRGTFAWVTCRHALGRLRRDLALGAVGSPSQPAAPAVNQAWVAEGSALLDRQAAAAGSIFLEDLLLDAKVDAATNDLAAWLARALWPGEADDERSFFASRFLVVHDDVFSFLAGSAMEVRARVQLDSEKGTVKVGPWSEEHIPAEAVLHGLVVGRRTTLVIRRDAEDPGVSEEEPWGGDRSLAVIADLVEHDPVLRFGGHSSVGLGRARVRLLPGEGAPR